MGDLQPSPGFLPARLLQPPSCPRNQRRFWWPLLLPKTYSPWLLVAVASVGNVLGAVVNWALGRAIERFRERRWFPANATQLERATRWYQRWGRWSLLLSWLPIGGDALTVVAGVLREPLWSFILLVTIAKTSRYLVLTAITLGVF